MSEVFTQRQDIGSLAAPGALADRVILVTGAYGGLGEAAAKACAQAGATVVLLGRKVPKLSRTYDAVKALGPTPALYPLDLAGADPADYEAMADTIASSLGGLHGVLHCGVHRPAPAGSDAAGGVRPPPACQPHRPLAADPGLPAAIAQGGR
jgi:NAD(P)-dependent dehydrogenase (short-subunit alcohol dehydrogenase family)